MRFLVFLALCLLSTAAFAKPHSQTSNQLCQTKFDITYNSSMLFSGTATVVEHLSAGDKNLLAFNICSFSQSPADNSDRNRQDYQDLFLFVTYSHSSIELDLSCAGNINKKRIDLNCVPK